MTDWTTQAMLQPFFGIAITVAAFTAAEALWQRAGRHALLNPVLVATATLAAVLLIFRIPYADYLEQAAPINETLSIIIILLAVPLCRQFPLVRDAGLPTVLALLIGSIIAVASALMLPILLDAGNSLLATIAPKSVTTAVAVKLADRLGGVPSVSAVIVISTGIFGAVFGPAILRTVGVQDDRATGFALGVASHAIGTARAFQISETAGVFASLGMILNALLTAFFMPFALSTLWENG